MTRVRTRLLEAVLASLIAASAAALRSGQGQPAWVPPSAVVLGPDATVEALQRSIADVRSEAATLVQREHGLLKEFGDTALSVENLYQQAQGVVDESKRDVEIARVLCSSFKSCAECGQQSICGWCPTEDACVPGDRLGVYAGVPVQCSTYHYANCALPA